MIKQTVLALAVAATGQAAHAGVYLNGEINSASIGSNYIGSQTDIHVGYEGGNDRASWFIQGGPAVVHTDGADSDTKLSGKVGGSMGLTEKLSAYGEFSFLTAEGDNSYGTKAGVKFNF